MVESGRNENSSKLLWLSLLPARIKKTHSKMKALEWSQHFFHCTCKSIGNYLDARVLTILCIDFLENQGQLTPVSGGIGPKFELTQAFIVILVICKKEEYPLKNEGDRVQVLRTFRPI